MTDATIFKPHNPGLKSTLLSKGLRILKPQRTRKSKYNNTTSRCTGRIEFVRPPHGTTTEVVISNLSDKGGPFEIQHPNIENSRLG